MLTQETKRKIDSARQILVGKVPDPKAQIDQITTALIYKFMDDMDKDAMELGGKARFFTNGFEKYAWSKILDPKLGGHDRLELYAEAITKLWQNNHLPQLFRDIFKDAFLPYRSPETLSLFLKEINGFTYNHSEDLGDAFEYLLSIMSSQGDAGQFRTPRHIIDFITEVVDPKKDESILDPACGTAGFLISAYKHILKQHDGKDDPDRKEKPLTPDDKKKLMNNLVGYDISPDMVKLSKVNMYLHGFAEPKIYEYDTLSSDEKWDEMYDVIMANPPFMSPKGGIRPHKRFSVQANRAEVLFVDYIKEHLRPNGRAGVIVPEGIIFKNDTAYKQLRRLLVEDGLFAVVSLPQGVFNPYAGVKTSILFFDNSLAKLANEILFVKVSNDGYDLGAQRRPISSNDLPEALSVIKEFQSRLRIEREPAKLLLENGTPLELESGGHVLLQGEIYRLVSKEKIAQGDDYNLSGDRYHITETTGNQKWPMVELGNVCTFEYGKPLKQENRQGDKYPVFGSNGIVGYHNEYLVKGPFIIVGRKGTAGAVVYSEGNGFPIDTTFYVKLLDGNKINLRYLYFILRTLGLNKLNIQAGVPGLNRNDAYKLKVPLPPLEIQKEIVEQIEVKQNAIDAAKKVIENLHRERSYFGREQRKLETIEMVELGKIAEIIPGQSPESKYYNTNGEGLPFYQGKTEFTDRIISEPKYWTTKTTKVAEKNDILMSVRAPVGPVNFTIQRICIGRGLAAIRIKDNEQVNNIYLFTYLQSIKNEIKGSGGAVFDSINRSQIEKIRIPIPLSTDIKTSMDIQSEVVEQVEWEEEIINSNRHLIELMEGKIGQILENIK